MTKYKVTQSAVTQLLEDVRREHIAIPELQRPFVWDSIKVRDLMDSLYKGYPVGYPLPFTSRTCVPECPVSSVASRVGHD
jgi:uncharacterized protein with ParB-like and HNH nuclease domain